MQQGVGQDALAPQFLCPACSASMPKHVLCPRCLPLWLRSMSCQALRGMHGLAWLCSSLRHDLYGTAASM
jgi:hypothetical protein